MPSLAQISVIAVASQCRSKHRYPVLRSIRSQQSTNDIDYGWSKAIFGLIMIIQSFGAAITFSMFLMARAHERDPIAQLVIHAYVTMNIIYIALSWTALNKNNICLLVFTCITALSNLIFCCIIHDVLDIHVLRKYFYPSIWPSTIDWSGLLITSILVTSHISFILKIMKIKSGDDQNRETKFEEC